MDTYEKQKQIGSLFSGIGGIELGFEREGFHTRWFVENNPYCQAVLRKHWKKARIYGDITKLDLSKLPKVQILTGGFPCQDISVAGKKVGLKEGKRSSLWSFYAKAIGILQPEVALIENVPNLINLGLDIVLTDLAEMGYDAEWFCLSASEIGAPHLRQRLFVIAYIDSVRTYSQRRSNEHNQNQKWKLPQEVQEPDEQSWIGKKSGIDTLIQPADNIECGTYQEANGKPQQNSPQKPYGIGRENIRWDCEKIFIADDWSERIQRFRNETISGKQGFQRFKDVRRIEELFKRPDIPQPLIRRGGDGLPARLDAYLQKERTQALGNAVVPQVAQFVARRIKEVIG